MATWIGPRASFELSQARATWAYGVVSDKDPQLQQILRGGGATIVRQTVRPSLFMRDQGFRNFSQLPSVWLELHFDGAIQNVVYLRSIVARDWLCTAAPMATFIARDWSDRLH